VLVEPPLAGAKAYGIVAWVIVQRARMSSIGYH
jgi:hypothetical protein